MKILVLNCGSSSIKYRLFDDDRTLARGVVEKIGEEVSLFSHYSEGVEIKKQPIKVPDHTRGIELVLNTLVDKGVIHDYGEIDAIGHRVVHGGEEFKSSVLIDDRVMRTLYACVPFAPLHNPHNIKGIESCKQILPNVPQVAVFDTAFHQTMEPVAFLYAIPYHYYERYGLRRYGFHGTSHYYVSNRAAELMGQPMSELKMITAHLGNGCSVAAIKFGKVVDTSMGFTPLEGLVMGTRSGDIDPAIVTFLIRKERLSPDEVDSILNKRSGLLGISGISNDMRQLIDASNKGNERARLAIDIFAYRVKKYISAYVGVLGGVDAIVFTAGIGENAPLVRKKILEGLEFMGIQLDDELNECMVGGREGVISKPDAKVKLFVIPTNEELVIARETRKIVEQLQGVKP